MKKRIVSVESVGEREVFDLSTSENVYVTENGLINHNSGIVYGSSVIMNLAKAQLKESTEVVGQRVIAKAQKNRFCKPTPCEFEIRFDTSLNPYKGLQAYVTWDSCGVGRGKFIDEKEYSKLTPVAQSSCRLCTANNQYFMPNNGRTICKDDGSTYPIEEFFTSKVFTDDVLERLDKVISPLYTYGSSEEVGLAELDHEVDDSEEAKQDIKAEMDRLYEDFPLDEN